MTEPTQDIQKKLAYYRRKFELNPRSRLFAPLADLLRKSGQLDEALEVIQNGLQEHPRYVSALVILGRCQTDAGSWAAAKDAFLRVVELDPDNLVALKYLADEAVRQEDWLEAVGLLERVITLDPTDTAAENELAQLRLQLQDPKASTLTRPADDMVAGDREEYQAKVIAAEDAADLAEADTAEGPEVPEATEAGEVAGIPVEAEPDASLSPDKLDSPLPAYTPPQVRPLESEPVFTDVGESRTSSADTGGPEETASASGIANTEFTESTVDSAEPADARFLATKTLADIYLSQGYRDKALAVLRQILARNPERQDIQEQITAIESSPREGKKAVAASTPKPASVPPVDDEVRRKHFENWITTISRQSEE
jgi:tetratricopeptide (TPR) repeat protein